MAMQKRFPVAMDAVFPAGAFIKGVVEPVTDFNAAQREDGTRPQQVDKDTGQLLWQVQVVDPDPEAGKKDTAVSVKIAAPHQPVPPHNDTPFPFTPVEFEGLTALAWVDDSGNRPRVAWSFRASGLKAPGGEAKGRRSGSGSPEQSAA